MSDADGFCNKCGKRICLWGSMALDVGLTHSAIVCGRCYARAKQSQSYPTDAVIQ